MGIPMNGVSIHVSGLAFDVGNQQLERLRAAIIAALVALEADEFREGKLDPEALIFVHFHLGDPLSRGTHISAQIFCSGLNNRKPGNKGAVLLEHHACRAVHNAIAQVLEPEHTLVQWVYTPVGVCLHKK